MTFEFHVWGTAMQHRFGDSDNAHRVDDADGWGQRVATAFVPARIDTWDTSFKASMRTVEQGRLRLSRVSASTHVLDRTAHHLRVGDPQHYVLCLHLSGSAVVIQEGRMAQLGPGDATVYDTSKPYTLEFDGPFEGLGVVVPAELVAIKPTQINPLLAHHMPGSDPVVSVVLETIAGMEGRLALLPAFVQHRLGQNVANLFETLCTHMGTELGALKGDPRLEQWNAVVSWIEDHLADPDLDPLMIADACFMSVRSLHNLARDAGTSVAVWIRHRRLEKCRADLSNPALKHLSVGAIGSRWGFVHATHFSTLFRAEMGMTPRAYRQECFANQSSR
ncbi:helix-turn-helix domain-containing protein [Arthrobacter sp. NPDC089319]|uniref:AraC-like ligand-binding domain-containing protein n=1 Tax=Arthrobacter sp. NPDC089319 TaxID=3155915 RepID=UPI00341D8B9D